ncbi:MAG: hypothetical protein KDK71_03390 [Chlamydiia bacterium]|nr:hypothetical protein [Chlamydiia bacterium]
MKRLLKLFLILFAFIALERLCHKATDGFAMVNVFAPPGNNDAWKIDDPFPENLCAQTFYYLNSGSQSYVFVSEDGTTVLKLFKFQHMRTPPFLNPLPSVGKLKMKREKKRKVLEKTFQSLFIAYSHMKEETGLLYLHLTKTAHLQRTVTLKDKIGRTHTLDLDAVEFLLQKRGTLAYSAIDQWMEKGEEETAKKALRSLLHLAKERAAKGIFDKDPDFQTNFGFVGESPIQLDFGRLSFAEEEKDPKVYGPEMIRITRAFELWIQTHHPSLHATFQEELHALSAS